MTCRDIRLLLTLAAAYPTAVTAALVVVPAAATNPEDFASQADDMVKAAYPDKGPGGAVLVTRGGDVVYESGRGLADIAGRKPISPDSLFKLGSIAKQFTAATVLKLVEDGELALDDPIARFFPDFPRPASRATVRQLLNHTSGITDYSKIPGWIPKASTRNWTTAELVEEVRSRPAKSVPGEEWEYNNAGYMMLGAIIEQVTGKPWHAVLEERITRPLGLHSIAYSEASASNPAMVRGYTGPDAAPTPAIDMSVAHAAGALVGNVRDLAKWAHALHNGQVVSPALYTEMTSPARLNDGSTRPYGFGLRLQMLRGKPAYVHGGAGRGLDTDSLYLPGEGLFVAVFANSDDPATDPSTLTRRLAALALGEPFPTLARTEVDMQSLQPLFGEYSAKEGDSLRFFSRDGKLRVGQGPRETEVFAAGDDRFFFGGDSLGWFRFIRKPDGAHVIETYRPDRAEPELAVRSGPVPEPFTVNEAVLKSYIGTFQTETEPVTVTMGAEGELTMTAKGWPMLRMRPVSDTEFHLDGTRMRVVFHPEGGKVNKLTIHRGARELHGNRVDT